MLDDISVKVELARTCDVISTKPEQEILGPIQLKDGTHDRYITKFLTNTFIYYVPCTTIQWRKLNILNLISFVCLFNWI